MNENGHTLPWHICDIMCRTSWTKCERLYTRNLRTLLHCKNEKRKKNAQLKQPERGYSSFSELKLEAAEHIYLFMHSLYGLIELVNTMMRIPKHIYQPLFPLNIPSKHPSLSYYPVQKWIIANWLMLFQAWWSHHSPHNFIISPSKFHQASEHPSGSNYLVQNWPWITANWWMFFHGWWIPLSPSSSPLTIPSSSIC